MDKNLEYEPVRGAHILMIVNPVSGRIGGEHTADKLEAWLKENGAAVDLPRQRGISGPSA